ncbi:LysE family translocator [Ciceribacter azotifigens]|uniref:LysE family translocator n=1 Tax=Ciceribacter azotifigens TaxID=2069303 RepID=UPI003A853B31
MTYTENLWLFFLLILGIIIVPGMDMIYVLASSLSGGRRQGLTATGGMMTGGAVHTLYGTLGTGFLVAFAPRFFLPLLVLGAAYMIWVGFSLVRSSITVSSVEGVGRRSGWTTFRQAVTTCLLNPKAYVFVLAVYPQFLKPVYGPIWLQGLVFGVMTILVQGLVYGVVALAGDRARSFLTNSPAITVWIGRGAGALLITAAAVTLWESLR